MLTKLSLILNISILLLHLDNCFCESGDHEFYNQTLTTQSLRKERIDEGVCEGEFDPDNNNEEWDLCSPKGNITQNETHCMCDQLCHFYKDCCVDIGYQEDINIMDEFASKSGVCIDLISSGHTIASVYGINRCEDNWDDTTLGVKDKCELSPQQYESSGQMYSYIQDIPVLSDKYIYANMFCAICNHDFNRLKSWNISIECNGFHVEEILNQTNKQSLTSEDYNTTTKKWQIYIDSYNTSINCFVSVKQFKDTNFLKYNNLRKCKKTIDKCDDNWNNITISENCDSYASYVYENDKVYKNYHCAICNYVPIEYIKCFPNVSFSRDWYENKLWFPLLLDFNFGGQKGEWVGGHDKCAQSGQIYEPIYEKCISIKCMDSSQNKCVINKSSKCGSNSFEVILEENKDFIIFENKSIYSIPKKDFIQEYNEVFDENNLKKIIICRNESQLNTNSLIQSPFDVSFGQILLSELSLYISIICLTLHLMVYIILPKLRNLPGKNLMSLSASLLIGNISFVMSAFVKSDRGILCVLIAITTHYSFMAAFFWMLIMALDIYKTFRMTGRRSKGSNRYRFLKYSLFGWLSPAFIVLISAAFDIALKDSKFRPLYGERFCWISQRQALLVFFAVPVFIIVMINICLFSLTAKVMLQTEEQTKILNKKSDKVRYLLYIKLAFLMGLTWLFGFLASLTDWQILWYPFIILNGLQGTAIFIAFTCKRKVINLLTEKLGFRSIYESTAGTDVVRSGTGSTSLQTSTLVPSSPDSNITKIKFTK